MTAFDRKSHWEHIYQHKKPKEVSWYQPIPHLALDFIREINLPETARFIDVGGGDSYLADHLLDLGYHDITVLDISEHSIKKAQERLGKKAQKVKWIVSDIVDFKPFEKYDFWNDRAAFHFLTEESEIMNYIRITEEALSDSGYLLISTFSESGPLKCSGIPIHQYAAKTLQKKFASFKSLGCKEVDHNTPFGTQQNFTSCRFQKI
ncbi:SAM-dependent methyltransferase [Robertkochia solimangrovi]|nr:class I SAM-dependent methyltransferase [Robertkochia solimangrovi]TRZ43333.1 SAM-dependent methyltransferase [Robertkochia solimangrovi]